MGLDVPRFNMQMGATTFDYTDGTGSQIKSFIHALVMHLAKEDKAFAGTMTASATGHEDRYEGNDLYRRIDALVGTVEVNDCRYILVKVKEALSDSAKLPPMPVRRTTFAEILHQAEEKRANPTVPISCVYCHVVQDGAPRISFDDEASLVNELGADSGRLYRKILERTRPDAAANLQMPPPIDDTFSPLSDKEYKDFQAYLDRLFFPHGQAHHDRL